MTKNISPIQFHTAGLPVSSLVDSRASLAALTLRNPGNWHERLGEELQEAGFGCLKKGSSLQVWRNPGGDLSWQGQAYSDGWIIRSFWVGPGRRAISVSPLRCYFKADGSRDERQEMKIVAKRPAGNVASRLVELGEFLELLKGLAPDLLGEALQLGEASTDLSRGCRLVSRSKAVPVSTRPNQLHREAGFDRIPSDFEALVVGADGVEGYVSDDFSFRLRQGFEKRGGAVTVRQASLAQVEDRLDALAAGEQPAGRNVTVVLVLGPRSQPVAPRILDVMCRLDEHKVPWRRAHSDDNRDFSIPDQLGSILMAGGGCPHQVLLPGGEQLPWSIGLDLSHPGGGRSSVLCAALINPQGQFVHAWTSQHQRDETIQPEVLRRLISPALDRVLEADDNAGVLLVRDGRLFEKEEPQIYLEQMQGRATLVELRKRGNPPLLLGTPPEAPAAPVFALADGVEQGRHVGFLVTLPRSSQGGFDNVLKLHWQEDWDGLGLGPESLARTLLALTWTPGLGCHPRYLPAPIYWADGIAGAGDEDLRFRGQLVTRLD